jgi:hypothetical protein
LGNQLLFTVKGHLYNPTYTQLKSLNILGNYALPSFVNEKTAVNLRAMRDDLYSGYCVFNVRKASPFLESLNALILKLHAAGLLLNYEGQVS